ncbi:unnamed protein product, partial [Oikopleura dioica]
MWFAINILFRTLRRRKVDNSEIIKSFDGGVGAVFSLFFHHNPNVFSFAVEIADQPIVRCSEILHEHKWLLLVVCKAIFEDVSANFDENYNFGFCVFHFHFKIAFVINKLIENSSKETFTSAGPNSKLIICSYGDHRKLAICD